MCARVVLLARIVRAAAAPDTCFAASHLVSARALSTLTLVGNRLTAVVGDAFGDALRACSSLTALDLSAVELGEGAGPLSGGLAVCTTLIALGLGGNGLGDSGATAVANALAASRRCVGS